MRENKPIIIKIGQVTLNGDKQQDITAAKPRFQTVQKIETSKELETNQEQVSVQEALTGISKDDGTVELQASALEEDSSGASWHPFDKTRGAQRLKLQTVGSNIRYKQRRSPYGWGVSPRDFGEKRGRMWWVYPALMGVTTGVAIGFGFLILFKSISFDQVVPVSAMPDNGIRSQMNLPGFSIWMDQVGSFKEKSAVDQQAGQLKFLGVETVVRGTSPFQLLAGVSGAKDSNSSMLSLLKQKSVEVYVKPYVLEDAKFDLIGLPQKDADQVSGLLNMLMKNASVELSAADQSISLAKMALPDKNQVDSLAASVRKAGYPQAAITLDQLYGNIVDASVQLKAPLNESNIASVEKNLSAFFIGNERIRDELKTK